MKIDKYNPYEDNKLHYTEPATPIEPIEERKGFNDVMDHYDAINGHQIPKTLDHFPKRLRVVLRWGIIIGILVVVGGQIYSLINLIH